MMNFLTKTALKFFDDEYIKKEFGATPFTIDDKIDFGERMLHELLEKKANRRNKSKTIYRDDIKLLEAKLERLRRLKKDGALYEERKAGIPKDIIETAIQFTVDIVDKKIQCQKSLQKYVKLKTKEPNRSVRDIHKEIDEGELDYGSLNNWVRKYREKLNALGYAHEK